VCLIGCGHQSQRIVPSFLVHYDMQMVAVCDVRRSGVGSGITTRYDRSNRSISFKNTACSFLG
jgi:hypothetical protein